MSVTYNPSIEKSRPYLYDKPVSVRIQDESISGSSPSDPAAVMRRAYRSQVDKFHPKCATCPHFAESVLPNPQCMAQDVTYFCSRKKDDLGCVEKQKAAPSYHYDGKTYDRFYLDEDHYVTQTLKDLEEKKREEEKLMAIQERKLREAAEAKAKDRAMEIVRLYHEMKIYEDEGQDWEMMRELNRIDKPKVVNEDLPKNVDGREIGGW